MSNQLQFTIPEILSVIGVAQCVYILVYMIMRAGKLSRAGLPILYFFTLMVAFLSDFGLRYIGPNIPDYFYIQWAAWSLGPPLSVLLVIQIAQISRTPDPRHYWVLSLIPLAFVISYFAADCKTGVCDDMKAWLTVTSIIAGSISLLAIWGQRGLFTSITLEKGGQARYWLILAQIFMNIFFLGAMLVSLSIDLPREQIILLRTILGIGFVYLVGTSLFRIYPQAVRLAGGNTDKLSSGEMEVAQKIENLLNLEKVYQEAAYSRTDLARECGTSEAVLSRIINIHFQKTFPQLMNEYRIIDAKRLLKETEANVRTVAEEVGFNSLATFNRVFKELTGSTPGQYREDIAA